MNIVGVVLGSLICIGNICSYIPQFHKIIKDESVLGISEMSLVLMNMGMMFLSMNSLIYNWPKFFCHNVSCILDLFPFYQICISWLMVLIFYIIFIRYKIKNYEKRIISALYYVITYLLFIILVLGLAIGEKVNNDNTKFFIIYANILGYASAVCNSIVYLPQIYDLYKLKDSGSLSFIMFAMQTPGNIIIIFFQAFLFKQYVSTWITYVITLIEQLIILIMIIYYHFKNKNRSDFYEIEIEDD